MLSKDHPIKRDDLLEDIPDNKAFYPCAMACAKSHLKWAEAFWLLLGFKSNNESKFCFLPCTFLSSPSNTFCLNFSFSGRHKKGYRKIFHPR